MNRSNYTHRIETHENKNVLVIEDLNRGNMSVTNNIEGVLDEIIQMTKIFIHSYLIIYRDSEGVWDGYNYNTEQFITLNERTWQEAAEKYAELQTQ